MSAIESRTTDNDAEDSLTPAVLLVVGLFIWVGLLVGGVAGLVYWSATR